MKNNYEQEEKKLQYDQHVVRNPKKKSLTAFSNQITAEENGGVDRRFFKSSYVQDNEHTIGFLRRLAKRWGVREKELQKMKAELLATGRYREDGRKKYFSDEDLWSTLISNETCKRYCDKRRIESWPEIIFYMYTVE